MRLCFVIKIYTYYYEYMFSHKQIKTHLRTNIKVFIH